MVLQTLPKILISHSSSLKIIFPEKVFRLLVSHFQSYLFLERYWCRWHRKKIGVQKSSPKSHSGDLDCYREWLFLAVHRILNETWIILFCSEQNSTVPRSVFILHVDTVCRVGIRIYVRARWADLGNITLPAHNWSWNPDESMWRKGVWRLLQNLALTVSKRHRKMESFSSSLSGFLNLSTVDSCGHLSWGLPCVWTMLSSNTSLHPLDASSISSVVRINNVSRHCLLGMDYPKLGTTALNIVRCIPRLPQVLSIRA